MQNTLKGWLVPNTVTPDPNDMMLVWQSAGCQGYYLLYRYGTIYSTVQAELKNPSIMPHGKGILTEM